FDQLQHMLPAEPSLVFIEISIHGTVEGRVYIRLKKDLPKIRDYVVQLVTGQGGPAMVGIKLNDRNEGCAVYAKDMPLSEMKFTPDSNGSSTAQYGDVAGLFKRGYLDYILFYFAAPPSKRDYGVFSKGWSVFGCVEDGMDVIKACHDNCSSNVKIADCGLVIEQK
ncbi:unnamed protein product, partial [Meganyctiphanes norvegica]